MDMYMIRRKITTVYIVFFLLSLSIIPIVTSVQIAIKENKSPEINSNNDKKEHWVVLICGGASDNPPTMFHADAEPLRKATRHAYETFKSLGYDDDHIYYLHDRNISAEGADGLVNKSMVNYTITEWLATHSDYNDDCCVYFIGHGSRKKSIAVWNDALKQYEHIFDNELAEWVDNINCHICTVVLDACHSGGFIKSLSKNNRILITSTSWLLYGFGLNESIFSYHFLNKLVENVSYGESWEYADKQLLRLQTPDISTSPLVLRIYIKIGMLLFENPKIDDNGDGRGHGRIFRADKLPIRRDGFLALETYPS